MNQKVLYSMMGLAALPLGAEAAVVQAYQLSNWEGTGLTIANGLISSDGTQAKYTIPGLLPVKAPGKYKLNCKLTTKVYNVDVEIAGVKKTFTNNPAEQNVEIEFTLNEAKDVTLTFTSSDPGVSGSEYAFTAPVLSLDFDFATIKSTLATNAGNLATTISGYNYAAKQEDVDAANALKTEANGIAESYNDYKNFKLYADKSTTQEKIDALADKAAKAEAAYQNEQAYGRVNAAITAIKAKYNTAVAELEGALVGAAAYLLDGALNDLNDNINKKITEATQASYASYQAGTAVADEGDNIELVPTEYALNNIVNNWKGQATTNINAYNTLHAIVTGLQADLDAIVPASDAIAALFPKTECQAAIDAINTKVENAKNKAAQLTLDINSDKTAAQNKINELAGKVNKANKEYNANEATKTALNTLETNLNNAQTTVNAKVSKDGEYKAQDYYKEYVEDIQKEIADLRTAAAAAYKVDGSGSAETYNENLNTTGIQTKIDSYKKKAVDAVDKYDALQAAMTSYQKDLDEVRGLVEGLKIYTDEGYDYKTKLDLIQKRINDIKKAITAAQEKKGADHWTAMLDIDADAAITADVKDLKDKYQADQNKYDKDYLDGSLTALSTSITTFNAGATLDKLGADYQAFADAEAAINTKVNNAQTEREAIDPADEKAAEKIVALSAKVDNIKAEQTALEAAAATVAAKVAANNTAKTTLATNIDNLQTKIGTFKTTYKIGQDDSTLGNRGKANGSVTKEVGEIETALGTLEGTNNAVTTTVVTKVEKPVAANGLAGGVYDVEVEVDAKAAGTATVNGREQAYAAGKNTYTLNNVFVSDGTLTATASGKEDKVSVKKLTYHENDLTAQYTSTDEEKPGFNKQYNDLATQENKLETAAPGIKDAVKANADTKTAADQAVTDLQTAELNTLKNLENVTNGSAENDDTTAKKADPADWKVFESGLAADKTYTAKKAAIDADITAMQNAINASASEEKLATDWQNKSITVGTGDNAKTYSIAALTDRINALKAEAEAENANWKAYKSLQDENMPKLKPDTITISSADLGDGAVAYYQGLKDSYITGKATILTNMQASLNARTAVSTKSGFASQIAALIEKVKVVKSDGIANKKKYDEQKAAYTETQTLWNNTYTEIAATDHSSQVQLWLDQLDAIQVDLTAATEAVETNYPLGKSITEAQDFAAIKAAIKDVKAQQSEGYNDQIAADNAAAHAAFKAAIAAATSAYQIAVQERAQYSPTNKAVKAVVDGAAATLDAALYSYPTDIATLTNNENAAYESVTSPTVFDVSTYKTAAETIKANINTALGTFKTDVKTALNDFWTGANYRPNFQNKVTAAENAIADYSDAAKTNAFKDVVDLIAKGDNGVNSLTLSEIEAAIDGLADGKIDDMLDVDKDKAAQKDLDPRFDAADALYGQVKSYIEGIIGNVENQSYYNDVDDALYNLNYSYRTNVTNKRNWTRNFAQRDQIKNYLNSFLSTANNCKTNVENAVASDVNNTKAYNEMMEAIVPVEAKLKEAKEAAAPYKYQTSFATQDDDLATLKSAVQSAKTNGGAVNYQTDTFNTMKNNLDAGIETTLTTAFGYEKSKLAADITELKNQYNAYVAANTLNETATAFKTSIDNLEKALAECAIKDLDDPADDIIQFDEIVTATKALIELQKAIADKETELLEANASTANADVLASFTTQLGDLAATASLEGNDPWVGNQDVNGKKISDWVEEINREITALQDSINKEPNLSFYKDQYQAQIDDIKNDLTPVVNAIAQKQAQFDANAAAYATLTAQLQNLKDKLTAAKTKVQGYKYAKDSQIPHNSNKSYWNLIDSYSYSYYSGWYLSGGVQYNINNASNDIIDDNNNVSLTANSNINNYIIVANAENAIQQFLDEAAYYELTQQINALTNNLSYAYDAASHEGKQKYSAVLWNKMIAENFRISGLIGNLSSDVYYSYTHDYWNGSKWIDRRSDLDLAGQMAIVADIQDQIDSFADAIDNIGLLGDANENGTVEVLDYQKVMNMILNPDQQPAGKTNLFANIDINQNEIIEVGDLTAIVNYILNKNWVYNDDGDSYAAVKGMVFDDNQSESLTMTSEMQQGVQRLAINLQNVEEYTAFQLDVLLPEGMTIVGSSLSDRAGQSHKLYSRNQLDGSIRFLASSILGESFNGNEGAVLYIDVKTSSEFKGGNVELLNVLFSDTSAQTKVFTLGADGEATGIDIMSSIESLKQRVYDLGGRMMNGMRKGINIIQGADGTSKKVLK